MANRFWVGGAGTWDASSTTHWASSSGGSSGASVPGTSDAVTFDGNSGGGTVTVNTTVAVPSITCGAFTGTLDFSVNNNNVTLSATSNAFSGSGSGTRTIKLGGGTWTFPTAPIAQMWNMGTTTNLTFDAGTSTIVITASNISGAHFVGGGLTYNKLRAAAGASMAVFNILGSNTFNELQIDAPNYVNLSNGITQTVTTLTLNGSAATAPIGLVAASPSASTTISMASGNPILNWTSIRGIAFTGGATWVANNSLDFGNNSGITINAPSSGGVSSSIPALGRGLH